MRRIAILAFLVGFLLPGAAFAQCQTTNLPAGTVLGRLLSGPGPCQAIPFAQLGPSLITSNLLVTAPLAITGLNLSITGSAGKVLGGAGGTFTATPTLGVASTTTGSLAFANSANTGSVTVQAPSTATNWTFKFPTTAGSNGQGLITDGSGNTSWAAAGGTVNSGTSGQVGYYATTAAAISGNANLNIASGALTIGVAGSQAGTAILAGATSGGTTFAGPVSGGGTQTFQAGSDTIVGRATTDTLTNKTLTSPTITNPTMTTPTLGVATATSLKTASIFPPSDSTTALQLFKADGSTRVVAVDTTNARVGINKTPGAFDLDVNGAANVGGALTYGTATVTSLTTNNSPIAGSDYLAYFDSANSRTSKATIASIISAATAGVSSLNGLTGGLSVVQGTGIGVSAAGSSVTVALSPTTGSLGNVVLSTSPTISAPTISGHPTIESITFTGGTGTGNLVASASPTLTGTVSAAAITAANQITTTGGQMGFYNGAVTLLIQNTQTVFNFCSNNACTSGSFLTVGSSGFTNISDRRVKENIKTLSVLDRLDGYRSVIYDNKTTGEKNRIGVIAQEANSQFPECVTKKGTTDPNEKISGMSDPHAWGVQYDCFGVAALQGVKELRDLVNGLRADNDNLRAQVKRLSRRTR